MTNTSSYLFTRRGHLSGLMSTSQRQTSIFGISTWKQLASSLIGFPMVPQPGRRGMENRAWGPTAPNKRTKRGKIIRKTVFVWFRWKSLWPETDSYKNQSYNILEFELQKLFNNAVIHTTCSAKNNKYPVILLQSLQCIFYGIQFDRPTQRRA